MTAVGSVDGGATASEAWASHIAKDVQTEVSIVAGGARRECLRQDKKWGVQDHTYGDWMLILTEEIGEISEAILKGQFNNAREEVVQCVAVLCRISEKLGR